MLNVIILVLNTSGLVFTFSAKKRNLLTKALQGMATPWTAEFLTLNTIFKDRLVYKLKINSKFGRIYFIYYHLFIFKIYITQPPAWELES